MVQAMKLKMKEQKGFTLIELLAVIVILGIIAAIAIPAIGNVINKSDNKAKVQDALLIIDAAKLYVADNNPNGPIFLSMDGAGDKKGSSADNAIPLNSYLDRVKDKDFVVSVTYTPATPTTAAKYSYSITNHDSVMVIDTNAKDKTGSVSEKELTEFK